MRFRIDIELEVPEEDVMEDIVRILEIALPHIAENVFMGSERIDEEA